MTPENTIDYVEIPAKDPAKAQAFFSGLFGWKFEDYGPDYCSFHDGRLAGGFHRADVAAAHEDPDTFAPATKNSVDPVAQVSISVIGEGLLHLRGPIHG